MTLIIVSICAARCALPLMSSTLVPSPFFVAWDTGQHDRLVLLAPWRRFDEVALHLVEDLRLVLLGVRLALREAPERVDPDVRDHAPTHERLDLVVESGALADILPRERDDAIECVVADAQRFDALDSFGRSTLRSVRLL